MVLQAGLLELFPSRAGAKLPEDLAASKKTAISRL